MERQKELGVLVIPLDSESTNLVTPHLLSARVRKLDYNNLERGFSHKIRISETRSGSGYPLGLY